MNSIAHEISGKVYDICGDSLSKSFPDCFREFSSLCPMMLPCALQTQGPKKTWRGMKRNMELSSFILSADPYVELLNFTESAAWPKSENESENIRLTFAGACSLLRLVDGQSQEIFRQKNPFAKTFPKYKCFPYWSFQSHRIFTLEPQSEPSWNGSELKIVFKPEADKILNSPAIAFQTMLSTFFG